jgi:ACS family glucarate transporter-like MFS transporter
LNSADKPHEIHAERPTNVRWIIFALSCASSWTLYVHRYTFALIKPFLIEEYDLTKTQLGWFDTVFSVCYTGFQVPIGILADVIGAHLVLCGALCVWSLALEGHALAVGWKSLAASRAFFGLGQAGCFATLTRTTKNWFPPSYRSRAQGFIGVFFGRMGGASANILFATVLIGFLGLEWRYALIWLVAIGAILALAVLVFVRDTPRQHPWVNQAEADLINAGGADDETDLDAAETLSWREIRSGMSTRSVINVGALNIQSILSTAADSLYSLWIPLFLSEVHQLKFKEMGIYASLPLIGGAIGGAMGGYLNDFWIQRTGNRRWSRSLVAFSGKGMAGLLLAVAILFFYDQPRVFCGFLFFVKLFGDWSLTTSWGVITDIGGKTSASIFAYNNSVAGLASMLAPPLFGYMSDALSWKAVFIVAAGIYLACATSWLFINCTIPVSREEKGDKP